MCKLAVLRCDDGAEVFSNNYRGKVTGCENLDQLMDDLADTDFDAHGTPAAVWIEHGHDGTLFDVRLGPTPKTVRSIGYYATRAMCRAYDIPEPELLRLCGPDELEDIVDAEDGLVYALSLMGDETLE